MYFEVLLQKIGFWLVADKVLKNIAASIIDSMMKTQNEETEYDPPLSAFSI